jgi:carboxylesterase type B
MELAANGSGIEIKGQEDCLLLNVYVPNTYYNAVESRAPVMVFIHGGGLVSFYQI